MLQQQQQPLQKQQSNQATQQMLRPQLGLSMGVTPQTRIPQTASAPLPGSPSTVMSSVILNSPTATNSHQPYPVSSLSTQPQQQLLMPPRSSPGHPNARVSQAAVPSMQLTSTVGRGVQIPVQQVAGVPGVMQAASMGMPTSGPIPTTMGIPTARMSTNIMSPRSSGIRGPSGAVGLSSLGGSCPQIAYRAPVLSPRAGSTVAGYTQPTLPTGAPHLAPQHAASSTQLAGNQLTTGNQLTAGHLGNSNGQITHPLQLMSSTGHIGSTALGPSAHIGSSLAISGNTVAGGGNVGAHLASSGSHNGSAGIENLAGQMTPGSHNPQSGHPSTAPALLSTTLPMGSAHNHATPMQQQRQ